MKNKTSYDVISPDGFSIHFSDTYKTKKQAKNALKEWVKRYENQGYYASNKGRIPLNELEQHCRIVEVDEFIETI
jgi:uncharacterized protein YaaR (DUF327 family)